jgi:hypothetical protein
LIARREFDSKVYSILHDSFVTAPTGLIPGDLLKNIITTIRRNNLLVLFEKIVVLAVFLTLSVFKSVMDTLFL